MLNFTLMTLRIIFLSLSLLMIIHIIDVELFNCKIYNKIFYGSDCSFTIPDGYKVVYNNDTKKYAVRVLLYPDYYLYTNIEGVTTKYSAIAKPGIFTDSCEAKGYLKGYLKIIQPTMAGFK